MHQTLTSLKQALKVAGLAATSSAMLTLGASDAWAGQATVVTVGDSSSAGTLNFQAAPNSAVGVSVTNLSTAVATGSITQAQADAGIGSGGAVVLDYQGISPEVVVAAIVQASQASQGNGQGNGQGAVSPQAALTALSASPALAQLTVTTPSGATVTIAQVLGNLNAALASGDAVILPTALNDAIIALLIAGESLTNGGGSAGAELESAIRDSLQAVLTLRAAVSDVVDAAGN